MDIDSQEHKLRLLAIYQSNYRVLETQLANWGMAPPIHLINEMKYHKQKIDELQVMLSLNAYEVGVEQILVSIEKLQELTSIEVKKAVYDYRLMLDEHRLVDMALALVMILGIATAVGLATLFNTLLKGIPGASIMAVVFPIVCVGGVFIYVHYRMWKYGRNWSAKYIERFKLDEKHS